VLLKRGQALQDALEAARAPKVAVIPTEDAPKPRRKAGKAKAKRKARR
jgi:hypothetical protein